MHGRRNADAGRHAEAHAGIIAGRGETRILDLHGGEQAIAHVRGHRHDAVPVEQIVDGAGNVGRHHLFTVGLAGRAGS